jgi:uroporphyrinogen decarboxylase
MALNSPLSARERVLLALQHRSTDRVPLAMVCSGINPPAHRALADHLRTRHGISVEAYLEPLLDIAYLAPDYVGPRLAAGEDIWGVRRAPVSYGPGSYDEICHYPLGEAETLAELGRYPWPSPAWFDYASLPAKVAASRGPFERALIVANGNLFESAWYMRGFERIFTDMLLRPEWVHALLRRITTFYEEYFHRVLSAVPGQVDLVFTADDLGGQRGLLMSERMWGEFLRPYHSELNALIHEQGARVIYHTDGAVMPLVPGLIAMGIDCLQALQFSADGMHPGALKGLYGDRLSFQGGISVQTTLAFGSPEDVAEEVRERIRVLAAGGGYILGPAHAIQAGTPPENIVAMFETALHCPLP